MVTRAVHVFFCGSGFQGSGLFALTYDRSGANLPKTECPAGWGYDKTIDFARKNEFGGIPIKEAEASSDLEKSGYHIVRSK
jgi:hypothetical protein